MTVNPRHPPTLADRPQGQTEDYLEGLMEGFVAYDGSWRMTYMNAAAERILGCRRQEVLDKTWHQAFPHAVGGPVDQMYQRVMRTRQGERMELFYEHYGRWFEISASPVQSGGVAVYFRDVSDRSRAHEALREETRTLETLDRVGKMLAAELDLERVVQAVTDAATELSGAAFGSFFYNVKKERGESYMLYTLSGVPREAFAKFPMPRNTAVFGPTFAGTGIVRSDDITKDPRYGRNTPHHGQPEGHLPVRSYLAVPVVSRSAEVLGGLFFGHPQPGVFTQRAEQIVSGIAAQAAVAIDNARLYRDLQRSKDDLAFQVSALTRLHDLAVQLGGMHEVRDMLQATLETIAYFHGTSRGLFSLYDPASGSLEVVASMGMDDATLERVRRVPPGPNAGACGSAFALRKRVVVEDTEADQCFLLFREVARAAGFRAVHSTPVLNRAGDILGIVSVHFDDPRRPSQAEMQLADMCARYAADAIESTRHQDALRESEERFRTLADSAPVLIWVNGPDQCEYVNRYYREFCGIDTVGPFDWSAVLHPEDRQAYVEAYVAAAGERSHFAAQCRVRRGSGDYRWVQSVGMPRFAPTGEWLGYVGCSVDITDLKSAGDQLREADRRKDEFLAVLAHELRNPLAPIRNGLHLLRAVDPQSSGAEQMRAMMERQVNHLVRLVDDLMELSRITTGKLELRKEPTELAAVVGSAVESSRPLMDAKGHRLRIHLPAEALRLNADPVRLAQVIANLLNNAAKYTHDRGEIVLETRRDADCAVVSVRDSGVGIPPDMLAHIFDKFTQVDTSYGRAQGGLGVGLSLARSLVELHGGSIEARSEGPGQGSEFIIRLPLAAWRNTAASVAPAVQGGARPLPHASRRILVVDDNADAADSLGMLLEHMGHQVHVVNDGESALAAARAGRPDVMFLDISMPGMDGYTVASRLRMDPRLAKTRIVAMTGHGQEDDRRKSREAGFDAHVVKPVAPESLGELLKM